MNSHINCFSLTLQMIQTVSYSLHNNSTRSRGSYKENSHEILRTVIFSSCHFNFVTSFLFFFYEEHLYIRNLRLFLIIKRVFNLRRRYSGADLEKQLRQLYAVSPRWSAKYLLKSPYKDNKYFSILLSFCLDPPLILSWFQEQRLSKLASADLEVRRNNTEESISFLYKKTMYLS